MCHKKGLFRVDILQLYYFMNIVEYNFNLSLAAKKIHISQPALSQFVSSFEKENEVKLFFRKNGRLQGLTEAGEHIYQYALKILSLYLHFKNFIFNFTIFQLNYSITYF